PQIGVGDVALEPALAELQLADDERVEQADDVRARADDVAIVVERALQRAGAAEPLAPLEHQHALAGAREVGGGGEAVVAAAPDGGAPRGGPHFVERRGGPAPAELGRDLVHVCPSGAGASTAPAEPSGCTITGLSSIRASPSSRCSAAAMARSDGGRRS